VFVRDCAAVCISVGAAVEHNDDDASALSALICPVVLQVSQGDDGSFLPVWHLVESAILLQTGLCFFVYLLLTCSFWIFFCGSGKLIFMPLGAIVVSPDERDIL